MYVCTCVSIRFLRLSTCEVYTSNDCLQVDRRNYSIYDFIKRVHF